MERNSAYKRNAKTVMIIKSIRDNKTWQFVQ